AAVGTIVHTDTVEAFIGDRASVIVSGGSTSDITVNVHSTEDIILISAAGGFAGSLGASGTAGINTLNETTRAYIGKLATVDATGTSANPNLNVTANDDTEIISVAGQLSAGTAGVGIGADVGVLTKTTEAYIESGVNSTIDGNIIVEATSEEDITTVAAGVSAGAVGVTIDASVHVLNLTTRAFIGDDPTDGAPSTGAGDVHAGGSVKISADDRTEIDKVVGALSAAGGVAGTASGAVTVVNKNTTAFIGAGAKVTGDGNSLITANTGGFNLTPTPEAPKADADQGIESSTYAGEDASALKDSGEVGTPDLTRTDSESVDDGSGGNARSNPGTSSDALTNAIAVDLATQSVSGVAVSATNRDDIETFAMGLSASAGASIALSAAVNVISNTAEAYIGSGAQVNTDSGGVAGQTVLVGAGNDFRHIAVSGSLAAGLVSIAPAVDVTILDLTTKAHIDPGAT
ncbi:MAG: hypothetical protein KAI25_08840, partial [Hyphomicrobiaceae bacterium]|nr:hypothetical protein [Hyphomicrobiaceae bacterium]